MIENLRVEEIVKLDIDKYANWLLNSEPYSKEKKKNDVRRIAHALSFKVNYRDKSKLQICKMAMGEIFYKFEYWKPPTEEIKNSHFGLWRKLEFEEHFRRYNTKLEGNPYPLNIIKKQEVDRIIAIVDKEYNAEALALFNKTLTDKYYEIACLLGCIDYLKFLFTEQVGNEFQDLEADKIIQQVNEMPPQAQNTFLPFPANPQPKVREIALYYYYIQEVTKEYFINHNAGKEAAIQEVAKIHSVSWHKLQRFYNAASERAVRQEGTRANKGHLTKVIEMLKDKAEAQKLAVSDLKQAELKTS